MVANIRVPFFTPGLPQFPIDADPRMESDLRDIYNAIRTLADQIGQYGGFETTYDIYQSPDQIAYTAGPYKRRVYCKALAALDYGHAVNLVLSGGELKAQAANATTNTKPAHGFNNTTGTCAIGDTIEIALPVCYVTSIGGLTTGAFYYLSTTDGLITNTPPAAVGNLVQIVGFAITANVLFVMPSFPINAGGVGTPGDVTGPAGAVDNHVVVFNGATGKVIKDSGLTLAGSNTGDQALTGDVAGAVANPIVTTIAAKAVTYAKIQDISATSRILGRVTAGAGSIEELTAANVKTFLTYNATDVGLGNVTNDAQTKAAIVPNTVPTAGQILVGNAGGTAYAPVSMSGDGTLSSAGALAVTKINGNAVDANVQTWLATPSSANLRAALTDESGAGALLFAGGNIGAATGTSLTCTAAIITSGTGMGYTTGAGGTVAQTTSKSQGVTLNKLCGLITMNAAALAAATSVSFVLTNSTIQANDYVMVQHNSGGTSGAYVVNTVTPAGGSATITVTNISAGSLSEGIVLRFVVFKAVTA
jgi:hypothetical protein